MNVSLAANMIGDWPGGGVVPQVLVTCLQVDLIVSRTSCMAPNDKKGVKYAQFAPQLWMLWLWLAYTKSWCADLYFWMYVLCRLRWQ